MIVRVRDGAFLLFWAVLAGCSSKPIGEPHVKTTPVTGLVQVDGKPVAGLIVECHLEEGSSKARIPVITRTDVNAKFCFTTYNYCDGLPKGSYRLAFRWQTLTSRQKDQLNGAYADPKTSNYTVKIENGTPKDLGVIELTTKSESQ